MSHDHHGSSSSMSASSMDMSSHSPSFCSGSGTVMLMGFQAATSDAVNCVLFLFEGAAVDTATKYGFAVVGAFCIGFANEMIRHQRGVMAQSASGNKDLLLTGMFAVQMFFAYMLMLLVMLYEYVFLICIILGLSAGHFVTLKLNRKRQAAAAANGEKLPSVPQACSSGTPCCNTGLAA